MGFSRYAAPGELQSPDATWNNGGIDPLDVLISPLTTSPLTSPPTLP
jgi:hypothetical protein